MMFPPLARMFSMALLGLSLVACRRPSPEPVADAPTIERQAPAAQAAPRCPSWADLDTSTLPPAPDVLNARVFLEIWDKLRQRHFDPTLNCLDWVALRGEYLKKVAAAEGSEQVYALYNELLAKLEQSHLRAMPPAPLIRDVQDNRGPGHAKAHWTMHGGKLYLRPPRPGEPEVAPQHRVGQVTHIDGVPVTELVRGPRASAAEPLSAMERAVRISTAMSCPVGGIKSLTVDTGQVLKVPCVVSASGAMSLGKLRNVQTQVRARLLAPRVGYLAFNVWMLPMLAEIRRELAGLQSQGMQALVLDLRGNRGGVASMAIPVARLIWPEGGSLGTIEMRDFRQELTVRANPKAFAGPVTLLIDQQSASTTEIFALGLAAARRARILGAGPSAGMALASILEGLTDGGVLQYVIGRYESPAHKEAEGRGVAPDRVVPYAKADLAAGRDPVLTAAVAELSAKVGTGSQG